MCLIRWTGGGKLPRKEIADKIRPLRPGGVAQGPAGCHSEGFMRILLTTTNYQDTPGRHHEVLAASGFEVVRARGPLTEIQMLDLVKSNDGFEGLLNGDDHITAKVIDAALATNRPLKVIAKYGIGL